MKHFVPVTSLLLGIVFFMSMSYFSGSFKADEVGLGRNTTSHIARFNGRRLSGIAQAVDSVEYFMKQDQAAKTSRIALWMGNSQLHSINHYAEGNHLAVEYVNMKLEKENEKMIAYQFSSPHLNLIEELLFVSEIHAKGIHPDLLIIPVTYRSFHFSTVRNELKNLTGYKQIEAIAQDQVLRNLYRYEKESDERGKLASKEKTWQDRSEDAINNFLTTYIPLYGYRENTKSFISFFPLQVIHFFSDKTKDLNVKGKDETVALNKKALTALLDYARDHNMKVILYQVPHPQDPSFFFYNKEAYQAFFSDIQNISKTYSNVTFLDLSHIVPLDLWGMSNDGYKDTYHFRDRGHQLLGDTIATTIKKIY